jgi:hypothetical protein
MDDERSQVSHVFKKNRTYVGRPLSTCSRNSVAADSGDAVVLWVTQNTAIQMNGTVAIAIRIARDFPVIWFSETKHGVGWDRQRSYSGHGTTGTTGILHAASTSCVSSVV